MGNDIFNYGSYAIDKNTLLRTLQHEDNIRDYSRYRSYTPEEDSEFRNIVQYLHSGIQNGTISGDGFGNFTDTTQNPYKNNRAYGEALNYIHRVANEIGNIKAESKQKSAEKFDVGKHSFQSYFLNELDPFNSDGKYDQSVKDYLEQYKDDEVGKVQDFVSKLENYQAKYNNFSGINFDEFGLTSAQYNDSLNKLKEGLKDGIIDTSDKVLANNLGIGNIINVLFDKRLNAPKQSNKFDVTKHGFKSYFAKSIASPFSTGNSYTTDLQDYIQGYSDQDSKIKDFTDKITAWQKSNNNFSDLDFSSYGLTPEQFNEGLENLKKALADGQIDHNDKMLAKNLGLSDVVNDVFNVDNVQNNVQENLIKEGWTINPKTNTWVTNYGHETNINSDKDPEEVIKDMQLSDYLKGKYIQGDSSWWKNLTESDQKRVIALGLDLINLFNPEMFTSFGAGVASDILTTQADLKDGDFSLGRSAINFGLSTFSLLPVIGDVATGAKIAKNIKVAGRVLEGLLLAGGVGTLAFNHREVENLVRKINSGVTLDVNDYRQLYNVLATTLGLVRATRQIRGTLKAGEIYKNSQDGLEVTVNNKGNKQKIVITDTEGIQYLKSKIDDPTEFRNYLRQNYEGLNEIELHNLNTKKGKRQWKNSEGKLQIPERGKETLEVITKDVKLSPNELPSKWSLARQHLNRSGNFSDGQVVNRIKTSDTAQKPTETSPEVTKPTAETNITQSANVPETTQVANTPASRIEPNTEINNKPTQIKSAVSEKSFDGLRNRIQRSLEPGDQVSSAANLHALEEQTKKAGKKASKKARDVYRKKKGVKPSATYTQALEDLKKSGMTDKQARTMLKDLNAFKYGGVIKAQTGIKFPKGVSVMEIGKYFDYDQTTGNYNIKNGVNINEVNEWLKSYGLNYNPGSYYGRSTDYTSTYDNGATSTGYKGANNNLRGQSLKVTSDTSEELDLNTHLAKYGMYKDDQASNRNADIINYYNSNNFENLNQFIDTYNDSIEAMYLFKRTPQGTTYDPNGNDSVRAFNQSHRNIYKSHNDLYGYDEDSENINGSATMARGIDITDQDVLIDTSSDENLTKLLGNAKLYKGKDGLLYYKEDSSLGNIRSMRTDSEDKPEDVMPKKPRDYDFSQLLDLGQYFHALNTNKKLYELGNEAQPLLYDPKEDHRYIVGNLDAKLLGQRQAAEKNRFAKNIANSTSDASLGAAVQLEAFRQGQNDILEGNRADNEAIKESTEKAWEQEVQNHENRYNIAMKNRENMYQINREKLLNKANYIRANHDSTTNYINKLAVDMKKKHQEVSNIRDFYYKQQLQGYAKRNPSQFVDGWSKYDSDVWSKGESGVQLDATEQVRYDQLRELVQQGYYNVLAKQNGVKVNTPHTGWLYNAEPTIKVIKEK